MNKWLIVCFCLATVRTGAQDSVKFDPHTWKPPYALDIPEGWGVERFSIPMSFAPSINYRGVEDIGFTPGWGKKESEEYWSYAFLWYLDSVVNLDVKTIEKNLSAYYTGLLHANLDTTKMKRKIPVAVTKAKKVASTLKDTPVFEVSVETLDFLTWQPLELHLRIYSKTNTQQKTFIFHEVSPKSFENEIWIRLHKLWQTLETNQKK